MAGNGNGLLGEFDEKDFDDNELDLLKKNNDEKKKKTSKDTVPYYKLFSYSTPVEKLCILLGCIAAIISGICQPFMMVTFGKVTGDIVSYVSSRNLTYFDDLSNTTDDAAKDLDETLYANVTEFSINAVIIAVVELTSTYLSGVLLSYSAIGQILRIRKLFLCKSLNQDVGWYDENQTGDFASILTDNIAKIEDGIGEKIGIFLFFESAFVSGIILGIVQGWKLALVCMVSLPLSTAIMGTIAWISTKFSKQELESYAAAGSITEEVFTSIRTVVAFDGQDKETKRYNKHVVEAKNNNIKRCFFNALSQAVLWFFVYGCYALSFWYGVGLVLEERELPPEERIYTPGNMIAVFFSTLIATWNFGMGAPILEVFGSASGAAGKVFTVLDSEPVINASKRFGKPPIFKSEIRFEDVCFHYPSRPTVPILRGFSLKIRNGEKIALVGSSGCGKSTCIQLLQRFYDPLSGSITIDGTNIKELNLTWFRQKIGVVSQEPALFATTISENIRYGKPSATAKEIEAAAVKANAHKFIMNLPHGYETIIGERGAQLSGGQKQRIAIARALVRQPSILLLDEATSALDTTSEVEVQAALDSISNECTTIIVAHRLSTVRNADRIIVMFEGKVIEEGTHGQLMDLKGDYFNLVNSQGFTDISKEVKEEPKTARALSLPHNVVEDIENEDEVEEKKEKEEQVVSNGFLIKILQLNKPEWFSISIGCLASVLTGSSLPIYGLVFGDIVGVLALKDNEQVRTQSNVFCLYFLLLGIVTGITMFLQLFAFGYAGEKLTLRIRKRTFQAMLRQEMGWFDRKENGVGALCAQLSGDAASVQGAAGSKVGSILNSISTFILSCTFALVIEWRLSLILLSFSPLILVSICFEQKTLQNDAKKIQKTLEKSAKIAVEVLGNIRTVASLGCEAIFYESYMKELEPYQKSAKSKSHLRALVLGVARSLMFLAYAAGMQYGAKLIVEEYIEYGSVFKVAEVIIAGSWSIGTALSFSPNFQKGLVAAKRIFKLLERVPAVRNVNCPSSHNWENGTVDYSQVYFSYPTRPAVSVLNGLNLSIPNGKTIALVGSSGCGKSTVIQLLERFYDPTYGEVAIDDENIKQIDLKHLRSLLGIVSQEPNLFDKTIAENIAYGARGNATMEEIIDAAMAANIHNFVTALPMGYNTRLGSKGTQLSGGQKQRIAIARALIRNPRILLLDEATSALDNESEKVVQAALDNAKRDRTCIIIAHRLTTIQDADVICVLQDGGVVESGKHAELLKKNGLYYEFYKLQAGHDE